MEPNKNFNYLETICDKGKIYGIKNVLKPIQTSLSRVSGQFNLNVRKKMPN